MSALERAAVARAVARAEALGLDVPAGLSAFASGTVHGPSWPAVEWARLHPDGPDASGCCMGAAVYGPERCTCWEPEFDVEQAEPVLPGSPEEIPVRRRMCGDCAFRPGSPERADEWMEEELLSLPAEGSAFFCHAGMRRPARWRHPDGRTVDGSPDDWRPAMVGGVPFRADGRVGELCAGWAAHARRAARRRGAAPPDVPVERPGCAE